MNKNILNLFVLLALFATVFSSCKDDDDDDKKPAVAKSDKAELTGVLYAGNQYAKPNATTKEVALTFVKSAPMGLDKIFFTISDGAAITKPTGVTKTSADHVAAANGFLATKTITDAPETLGANANVWEMALPDAAGDVKVTVTAEDGTNVEYTLKIVKDPRKTDAELTGVLYALQQYATPDNDNNVALTFDDPSQYEGASKLYFIISDGATITKPATGVTKTPAEKVVAANTFLGEKTISGAPETLGANANIWEMLSPTAAGDVEVEITAEDGTTKVYTLKIVEVVVISAFKAIVGDPEIKMYGDTEALEFFSTTKGTVNFSLNGETDTKWTIAPDLPSTLKTEDIKIGSNGVYVVESQGSYTFTFVGSGYTLAADTDYTLTGTSGGKSATRKFTLKAAAANANAKAAIEAN